MSEKASRRRRVLLVDDEPEYLEWIIDFLDARGFDAITARTVQEAFDLLGAQGAQAQFAVALVDMNIPSHGAIGPSDLKKNPLIAKYAGLAVASRCRNRGLKAHQVIGYTVHDDDAIDAELSKLDCRYVLKARPEVLKRILLNSLEVRPPKPKTGSRGKRL